jgi:hypothetical protein
MYQIKKAKKKKKKKGKGSPAVKTYIRRGTLALIHIKSTLK